MYNSIIDNLEKLGFRFRMNDLDETLEVSRDGGDWQRISDTIEAIIRTRWRDLDYGENRKPSLEAMRDAFIAHSDQKRYNPIREYFLSLEGKYQPDPTGPFYINLLATYFDDPDMQFQRWLFLWMTGTLAKIFRGERNPMLVLASGQTIGKSTWAKWMCPPLLHKHFLKSNIDPDNKDHKFRLSDTLIWEVEELGSTTRRADVEALKAFITLPFIFERPSYGRHPIYKPAVSNFIGTVNPDGAGFLNDPTGNTRFLVCEINKIDFRYTEMDVNNLWNEAFWYYRNMPGCWQLTTEDRAKQTEINSRFEVALPLDDTCETRLNITLDHNDFMTTQQIKDHLFGHHSINSEQQFYRELGRVLHKRGCRQGRKPYKPGEPHLKGWFGVKRRELF